MSATASTALTNNSSQNKRSIWGNRLHINNVCRNVDIFGRPIPSFKMNSEDKVNTVQGGWLSCFLGVIMLIYATIKLTQLVNQHNPNISQFTDRSFYDYTEKVSLTQANFKFAFSVEGYFDQEMKDSSKYVKYIVRARGNREGKKYEKILPYHKCTEEDWNSFPTIARASSSVYESVKNDPKRGMFCLDWQDNEDYSIYGREIDEEY